MLRSCGLFQWLNPKNIDRLFSLKYDKGEGGIYKYLNGVFPLKKPQDKRGLFN